MLHVNFTDCPLCALLLSQLSHVCPCNKGTSSSSLTSTVCTTCHLSASPFWPTMSKYDLQGSLRHSEDPDYSAFCQLVRKTMPSHQQLHAALSCVPRVTQDKVPRNAVPSDPQGAHDPRVKTVLCTHNADAECHNFEILKRLTPDVHDVHMGMSVDGAPQSCSEAIP